MALNTTTSHSNQFARYFEKVLLDYAKQTLVLDQFGMSSDLPRGLGSKTVRFFRPMTADSSRVVSLSEGVPITTISSQTYTAVDIDLAQFGELFEWTDILGWTALLKVMEDGVRTMGEDCALKADDITLTALANATTGGTKRYAQGGANWAALAAGTAANFKYISTDGLGACTALRVNMAPRIGSEYIGIVGPQVGYDLMLDTRWLNAKQYSDVQGLYKGEIGMLDGIRYVMTTNVWYEDGTAGAEATRVTTPGAKPIYLSIFTGKNGYGTVALSGQSPYRPQIMICDTPDKSDPANQLTTATWKAFYQSAVLNANWVIAVRSRGTYA
jgi:N4-gp56 family major capsid protein